MLSSLVALILGLVLFLVSGALVLGFCLLFIIVVHTIGDWLF